MKLLPLCIFYILGDPPHINKETAADSEESTIEPRNKRVNVGSPVNVSRGFNLTIDCIVISGTPPITISWIRSNNDLINSSEGNSSNITINVTDAHDGDNITCRADNNIGYDMATTTMNVESNFNNYVAIHNTIVFYII